MPDPRPLTSGALHDLVFLSDPRLTSDGGRAFLVRTTIEVPKDAPPRYRKQVCEADLEGGGLRVLAEGPKGADAPRPSPDGRRLAFLSERDGADGTQVQLLDLARGGEARRVTRFAGGVREFVWRPDGGALAVLASDEAPEGDPDRVVARTVDRLHAKRDGLPSPGVRTGAPRQAWLVDPDGGEPVRLTDAEAGVDDLAWDPDGRTLWYLAATDVAESDAWRACLWRLDLDLDGRPQGPPERRLGPLTTPAGLAVAPDGTEVAWLGPSEPERLAAPTGLWTASPTGAAVLRTGDEEAAPSAGGDARHGRYPNRPVRGSDGWVANLNREGAAGPVLLGADGARKALVEGRRVVTAFDHAAGRTLAIVESPDRPGEAILVAEDGRERRITRENDAFVERHRLVASAGAFRAPRSGDDAGAGVPWWRLEPREPRADRAIVVQVHGGPHTNAGWGFSFEHQLLAARGYAVVWSNPRGSSGYGLEHRVAMLGRYGTVDADDVLAVVEDALARHDDPEAPVHLTGGSYGGFMTNWLTTRTDRFRSAVTQRSICNWLSFYGTSDIGYRFAEAEVEGTPWNDTERLWRQSPLARVDEVRTPILILHADADHRCPVEQAEQWYVALKRLGRAETRLVRFPDEGHELSRSGRPDRRVRRLDEIVDWFETHP